jgi:phytoene synthase
MPEATPRTAFARPADLAACRELIRTGSRSFFLASLLLPDAVREGAYAIYGFCRLSDDEVDVAGGDGGAVERLRHRLERIYSGAPGPEPVDRALADAIHRFGVPREALEALLEGLDWDAHGRAYETLSDVLAYAARVAGSVGAMMAALMGARSPHLVARACDLGLAMQLTNICRDVGEDARMGRLYLPRAWLRQEGVDPDAWLAEPAVSAPIARCVERLLAEAETLYLRADTGIDGLGQAYRPAIFAARYLYAEIGREVERNQFDSITRRARVPYQRKAALVAKAVARAGRGGRVSTEPARPEVRFIADAVPATAAAVPEVRARGPGADLVWTLELFTDLARRRALPMTGAQ